MEWHATYLGSAELPNVSLDEYSRSEPNLTDAVLASAKEIKKAKGRTESPMNVAVNPSSVGCSPKDSSSTAIYQPIGKLVFLHSFSEGAMLKSHYFAYVAVSDDTRVGGPGAKYHCHLFKCKSEEEANAIAFAIRRTLSSAAPRAHPEKLDASSQEQLEAAVRGWNNSTPMLLHYSATKGVVTGNMKVQCQVDASLRTATKMVKLTSTILDDQLIELLASKFNLSNVDFTQYAVYDRRDSGEQVMLGDGESPLIASLRWTDPSEGAIWLQKLPPGLVRLPTARAGQAHPAGVSPAKPADSSQPGSAPSAPAAPAKETPAAAAAAAAPAPAPVAAPATPVRVEIGAPVNSGPLLPYAPEDEDLLLSVMITRQSGTGLGFKLTPAYLLQMCIAYCSLHLGEESLRRLLAKVVLQISSVVANNPSNPEMLLFWLCNSLKLTTSLVQDAVISGVFADTAKTAFESTIESALRHLKACAAAGQSLPAAIERSEWSSQAQLRAVIVEHYRALDSNMDADSLLEVVARITAAMPSPTRKPSSNSLVETPQLSTRSSSVSVTTPSVAPSQSATASTASQAAVTPASTTASTSTANGPMTSTPLGGGETAPGSDISVIQAPHRSDPENALLRRVNGIEGVDTTNIPRQSTRQQSPLPQEWEELVDPDTQHRFFANHVTRQTSWTDPRDKLTTVTLVKGDRGLGLGISGAKRTWDDRLVLGIFVSSLVPESAAALDASLREGDEILEVNGHSLIGVSREGAIEFLKQVRQGEKVTLLVAQEPVVKVALKQTAL